MKHKDKHPKHAMNAMHPMHDGAGAEMHNAMDHLKAEGKRHEHRVHHEKAMHDRHMMHMHRVK